MKKNKGIFVAYVLIIVAAVPVFRYFYIYYFDSQFLEYIGFVLIRIFLSVPILIFSGVFLLSNKGNQQKIIGTLSLILGVTWAIILAKALLAEMGY